MTRWEIINRIIGAREYTSFLEIGTKYGETFTNVNVPVKVSVDPDPKTRATFIMTSDEYFRGHDEKFDLVFVDGLHECSQAFRDVMNALKVLNPGGVIVMHDCHPQNREMQEEYRGQYFWTGDVWKAFVALRATLDYEMYVIDEDFGCGIIDTAEKRTADVSGLPTDMDRMTYDDYKSHPEWMDFRKEVRIKARR